VAQIRLAFWTGLCSLLAGAALLAVALYFGQPQADAARTLHNVISLVGLLLASGGAFMAVCTGPVLLATLLAGRKG
jgi:hypothetical protein